MTDKSTSNNELSEVQDEKNKTESLIETLNKRFSNNEIDKETYQELNTKYSTKLQKLKLQISELENSKIMLEKDEELKAKENLKKTVENETILKNESKTSEKKLIVTEPKEKRKVVNDGLKNEQSQRKSNLPLVIALTIIVVGAGALLGYYYLNNQRVQTSPTQTISNSGWWDSNWPYRVKLNIQENSGTTLHSYSVVFSMNTQTLVAQGKMKQSCGDIRIYDSASQQQLDYAISNPNSPNTQITFQIPQLNSYALNDKIFLYYGNSAAPDGNKNWNDVYYTFNEDFNQNSLSKWTSETWSDTRTKRTYTTNIHDSQLDITSSSTSYYGYYEQYSSTFPIDTGAEVVMRVKTNPINDWYCSFQVFITDQSSIYNGNQLPKNPNFGTIDYSQLYQQGRLVGVDLENLHGYTEGGYLAINNAIAQPQGIPSIDLNIKLALDRTTYHEYKMITDRNKVDAYLDGTYIGTYTSYVPQFSGAARALIIVAHSGAPDSSQTASIDYIRVRNYTATAPSVNIGSEEKS